MPLDPTLVFRTTPFVPPDFDVSRPLLAAQKYQQGTQQLQQGTLRSEQVAFELQQLREQAARAQQFRDAAAGQIGAEDTGLAAGQPTAAPVPTAPSVLGGFTEQRQRPDSTWPPMTPVPPRVGEAGLGGLRLGAPTAQAAPGGLSLAPPARGPVDPQQLTQARDRLTALADIAYGVLQQDTQAGYDAARPLVGQLLGPEAAQAMPATYDRARTQEGFGMITAQLQQLGDGGAPGAAAPGSASSPVPAGASVPSPTGARRQQLWQADPEKAAGFEAQRLTARRDQAATIGQLLQGVTTDEGYQEVLPLLDQIAPGHRLPRTFDKEGVARLKAQALGIKDTSTVALQEAQAGLARQRGEQLSGQVRDYNLGQALNDEVNALYGEKLRQERRAPSQEEIQTAQHRIDQRLEAKARAGVDVSLDKPLSADDAARLGVPIGTTARDVQGRGQLVPLTGQAAKDYHLGNRMSLGHGTLAQLEAQGVVGTPFLTSLEGAMGKLTGAVGTVIGAVTGGPVGAGIGAASGLGVGGIASDLLNLARTPGERQYLQAQLSFLAGILRKESGAAITAEEYRQYSKIYFPSVGDDAETIKAKRDARQAEIDTLQEEFPGRPFRQAPRRPVPAAPPTQPAPAPRIPEAQGEGRGRYAPTPAQPGEGGGRYAPTPEAPTPPGRQAALAPRERKVMTLADVADAMRETGRTRAEVERRARERGYSVFGSRLALPEPTGIA